MEDRCDEDIGSSDGFRNFRIPKLINLGAFSDEAVIGGQLRAKQVQLIAVAFDA
jgi:hypothetical protein